MGRAWRLKGGIGRQGPGLGHLLLALVFVVVSSELVAQESENGSRSLSIGRQLEASGDLKGALSAYDAFLRAHPSNLGGLLFRGQVRFILGDNKAALEDFNRLAELNPEQVAHLWQRGIVQYYEGRYVECAGQFELHRLVNPNDVENAAWHFLCVARSEGTTAAREALLPVGPDPRVPFEEVYRLFAGSSTPQRVLAVVDAAAEPANRARQLFYANLYVGLLLEVRGEVERGRGLIGEAAATGLPGFMGAVPRVHLSLAEAASNR